MDRVAGEVRLLRVMSEEMTKQHLQDRVSDASNSSSIATERPKADRRGHPDAS